MTEDLKTPPTDAELPNRGLRVTPADIDDEIASEHFFTAGAACRQYAHTNVHHTSDGALPPALDLLTFCVLVLKNGFTVTGESACAAPENFDGDIGRRIAREAAVRKVWPLLGFRLRDRLVDDQLLDALQA